MTRTESIARLADLVSASEYPTLTDAQLGELIDDTARWSVYAGSTAYTVGDIVTPSTANGRQYVCVVAGTSDATTEPTWVYTGPKGRAYADASSTTLLWQDDGSAHKERYDLYKAANRGWKLKASLVAGLADSEDGDLKIRMSQLHAQCLEQAKRFRGGGIY